MSKTKSGGWGRVNNGQRWTVMATDIDRALARADLTRYEAILIQYLRETSWGSATLGEKCGAWPDPKPVPWKNPTALAQSLGVPRPKLSVAKTRLVESKMILENREGLLINKNVDQWVFPSGHAHAGQPRLDNASIVYCASAWSKDDRPNSTLEHGENAEEEEVETPFRQRNGLDEKRSPNGTDSFPDRNGSVPQMERIRSDSGTAHYKGRAHDLDSLDSKILLQPQAADVAAFRSEENSLDPPPDEFLALVRRASEIAPLARLGFPAALEDAWHTNGSVQAWWHDGLVPRQVWHDSLNDLAGFDAGVDEPQCDRPKRLVRFYLGCIRAPGKRQKYRQAETLAPIQSPTRVFKAPPGTQPPKRPRPDPHEGEAA